jgi:hypothetical protein
VEGVPSGGVGPVQAFRKLWGQKVAEVGREGRVEHFPAGCAGGASVLHVLRLELHEVVVQEVVLREACTCLCLCCCVGGCR